MPLEIDKAVNAELERLEADGKHEIQATIDTAGVEAEVSTETKGWTLAGYVKKAWKGPWIGGGKVRKTF